MIETVFQIDNVPAKERFGYWHDLVSNSFAPTYMSSDDTDNFYVRQRMLHLGDVEVWEAACSPSELTRTAKLVSQSDPEKCCVAFTQQGTLIGETSGRRAVCEVGDFHCHDTSHPREVAFRAGQGQISFRGISIMIPRADLSLSARKVDRIVGARFPGDDGVGGLLSTFVTRLVSDTDSFRPADGARLGVVVVDLISTLFASGLDCLSDLPSESHKQVLGLRIKAFILQNLSDPDLTPATIAAAHHISLSYLYQICQSKGIMVSSWIRRQRLENACRDLADPAQRAVAIQNIAGRWGFKSATDFTRSFRATYGLTPRDYRNQAP